MRVAAGAIARKVLDGVVIRGALVQMGKHKVNRARWSWDAVNENPFFCPDPEMAKIWEGYLDGIRKAGSSIGAVIEVVAEAVPAGLGAPVYGKLDQDLASAMMSINAVKAVEIGAGMAAAELTGEENADEMRPNAIPMAAALRPGLHVQPRRRYSRRHLDGPAHRVPLRGEADVVDPDAAAHGDDSGEATEIVTKGRHDPCVGIRAVPVGEAMMAIVLADHLLRHRGQCGGKSRLSPS